MLSTGHPNLSFIAVRRKPIVLRAEDQIPAVAALALILYI